MSISEWYVVYELNRELGGMGKSLEEAIFMFGRPNRFNSETEAIMALVKDEKTYADFIILKQVSLQHD